MGSHRRPLRLWNREGSVILLAGSLVCGGLIGAVLQPHTVWLFAIAVGLTLAGGCIGSWARLRFDGDRRKTDGPVIDFLGAANIGRWEWDVRNNATSANRS